MKENIISRPVDLKINKEMPGLGSDKHQTMRSPLNNTDEDQTLSDETNEEFNLKKNRESQVKMLGTIWKLHFGKEMLRYIMGEPDGDRAQLLEREAEVFHIIFNCLVGQISEDTADDSNKEAQISDLLQWLKHMDRASDQVKESPQLYSHEGGGDDEEQ